MPATTYGSHATVCRRSSVGRPARWLGPIYSFMSPARTAMPRLSGRPLRRGWNSLVPAMANHTRTHHPSRRRTHPGDGCLGRIARDVLVPARPEIAEITEPAEDGRGESSTLPHKVNPILSLLIRRATLTAPGLAAQLHLAAAEFVDERADGAWHTERATVATLGRHNLPAAAQTAELLTGLHVDTGRMARLVGSASTALLAEERNMAGFVGQVDTIDDDPTRHLGSSKAIIDAVLECARSGGAG